MRGFAFLSRVKFSYLPAKSPNHNAQAIKQHFGVSLPHDAESVTPKKICNSIFDDLANLSGVFPFKFFCRQTRL
jgi:hypothetical protein